MPEVPNSQSELFEEYRRGIEIGALPRSLRIAVFVFFVIQTLFIGVDWLIYADRFAQFLPLRIGLDTLFAFIYFRTSNSHPLASTFATCLAGGGMLLTMIHGSGGVDSEYYVGLVLLILGTGVFVPLSARQAAVVTSILLGGYIALPAFAEDSGSWARFVLHCVFLSGAAFGGVMSCALLDRLRFADFKQRRELEAARDELKQLDQQKSRFTANVHHELRTPLTLTLAPLEAMLSGEFGEVMPLQRRYLRTMHVNALRLLKMVNNLLDLAKIESDQLTLHRRPCEPGRVADDVVAGAQPLAEQKGVELVTAGLDTLPEIQADPDALEKVVVNLLGNALKFTDSGGRIEVCGEVESAGIHLAVADTGVGIPPDQLERIFDRFAQVDASATRKHEGTGIGLSLAKELVELHGGRVWAESEGEGRGSTLHVHLPIGEADDQDEEEVIRTSAGGNVALGRSLAAVEAELAAGRSDAGDRFVEMQRSVERSSSQQGFGPDAAEARHEPPPGAPEIVVAEDNADMRRLLAFLLGREFRVRLTPNGREALAAVRESLPDLVLTDVMMPEMSGTELCRELKGDPVTAGVPVVLVTSKAEREMKIEGLEIGADDYVTKPFHPRELLARVRSLVHLRQLQRNVEEEKAALDLMNQQLRNAMGELKEAEVQVVQSQRLAAVGELVAGVAHEVNNPVNFAVNALKTLRLRVGDLASVAERLAGIDTRDAAKLPAQIRELDALWEDLGVNEVAGELIELIGIVAEGLERTHRLVGDLRDFAGAGTPSHSMIDVRKSIESTLRLIRHALKRTEVRLEADLGPDPLEVRGSAGALNQVFLNLIKNSAEALEGNGGSVQVIARRDGDRIAVCVRDDGPGLAEEAQRRLFEPFFSTKEAGRGTGLGLAICRRIVTEHGGTIVVSSPPGEGASFTVHLPAAQGKAADAT